MSVGVCVRVRARVRVREREFVREGVLASVGDRDNVRVGVGGVTVNVGVRVFVRV